MDVLSAIKTASREEQKNEAKANLAFKSPSSESSFSDLLTQADLSLTEEGPAVTSERLAEDSKESQKHTNPSPEEYAKGSEFLATTVAKESRSVEISAKGKGERLVKSAKELLSWELERASASHINSFQQGNKSGERAKVLFLDNNLFLENNLRQTTKSDNPLLKTVTLFFPLKDNLKDGRDSQLFTDRSGKIATNPLLTTEVSWRMGFRPSQQKQKGQQVEKWQEDKSQEPSLPLQAKKANFTTPGRSEKANQIPSGIPNPTLDFVSRETISLRDWFAPAEKSSNEYISPLRQYRDNRDSFITQERLLQGENPKSTTVGKTVGKNETFTLNRQFEEIIQNARLQLLENGNASLTARLFPKELGSITVNLTLTDGIVSAKFTVANETVQRELISYLENIRQQLQEDGILLSSFTVNVGGQAFSKQQNSLEESSLLGSIARKAGDSYEKNSLTKTVAWEGLYA